MTTLSVTYKFLTRLILNIVYILLIIYLLNNILTYEVILEKGNALGRELVISNLIIGMVVGLNLFSTGQIFISLMKKDYLMKHRGDITLKLISGVIFWGIAGSFLSLAPFINREIKISLFLLPTLYVITKSEISFDNFRIKKLEFIKIAMIIFLFVINVIPIWNSGDGFEHYLPYMNEVFLNQNTMPNDLWYHFDLSRNFGLTMLSVITFGPLAFQIVNSIIYILILLIVLRIIRNIVKNDLLSYIFLIPCALLIFPRQSLANSFSPELLRHQFSNMFVIASLILLISTYYKKEARIKTFEKALIGMICFYAGNTSIITTVYLMIFFLVLYIINWISKSNQRDIFRNFSMLLFGLLTQVIITWLIAGYFVSPFLKSLWKFSDKREYFNKFGELPFTYFYTQLDLEQPSDRFKASLDNNLIKSLYEVIVTNLEFTSKNLIFVFVLFIFFVVEYKKIRISKRIMQKENGIYKILVSLILAWIPINLAFPATGSTMRNSVILYPAIYLILVTLFLILYYVIRNDLRLNLKVFVVVTILVISVPNIFNLADKRFFEIYMTLRNDDYREIFINNDQIEIIGNIDAIKPMLNDSGVTYYLGYRPALVYSAFGRNMISEPSNIVNKDLNLNLVFSANSSTAREELSMNKITSFVLDSRSKAMPGIGFSSGLKDPLFFNLKSCQDDFMNIEIKKGSLESDETLLYQGLVEAQTSLYFSEIYDFPKLFETILKINKNSFYFDNILNIKGQLNYINIKYNRDVIDKFDEYVLSLMQSNQTIMDQSYDDFLNGLKSEFSSIFIETYKFQDIQKSCANIDRIKENILTGVLNETINEQKLIYLDPSRLINLFGSSN